MSRQIDDINSEEKSVLSDEEIRRIAEQFWMIGEEKLRERAGDNALAFLWFVTKKVALLLGGATVLWLAAHGWLHVGPTG